MLQWTIHDFRNTACGRETLRCETHVAMVPVPLPWHKGSAKGTGPTESQCGLHMAVRSSQVVVMHEEQSNTLDLEMCWPAKHHIERILDQHSNHDFVGVQQAVSVSGTRPRGRCTTKKLRPGVMTSTAAGNSSRAMCRGESCAALCVTTTRPKQWPGVEDPRMPQ